jgi:eukaryotic-like serine/threonine-protein kinase
MVASAGVDAAWPGRVLRGRWELVAQAAQGGSGRVWRGRDRTSGVDVAVKLVEPEELDDEARFRREIAALASVRAEGVVAYRDHGVTPEGVLFLVSEWLDGETLRARLEGRGLTAAETLGLAHEVAVTLGVVHAAGLVHRDVKPENLFLTTAGVRLLDFGLVRKSGAGTDVTRSGLRVGTPAYMAPEQLAGRRDLDARVDVYALGCVIYEGLAGRAATSGRHAELLVAPDSASLATLCPEAPEPLIALIGRLLAVDRAHRPTGGAEVAAALAPFLPGPPGPRRRALDGAAVTQAP